MPDALLVVNAGSSSLKFSVFLDDNSRQPLGRREHPRYRDEVLPESVDARVSVEQASTLGWPRYVGRHGRTIGMETFGASAPLQELQKKFGFTVENIVEAAKQQLAS